MGRGPGAGKALPTHRPPAPAQPSALESCLPLAGHFQGLRATGRSGFSPNPLPCGQVAVACPTHPALGYPPHRGSQSPNFLVENFIPLECMDLGIFFNLFAFIYERNHLALKSPNQPLPAGAAHATRCLLSDVAGATDALLRCPHGSTGLRAHAGGQGPALRPSARATPGRSAGPTGPAPRLPQPHSAWRGFITKPDRGARGLL